MSVEEHLAFDIGFALPRAPIKGLRWGLSEEERRAVAVSIVEHLKLCGWKFQMTPIVVGQGRGGADWHLVRKRGMGGRKHADHDPNGCDPQRCYPNCL
jgi:hypothetical protein